MMVGFNTGKKYYHSQLNARNHKKKRKKVNEYDTHETI